MEMLNILFPWVAIEPTIGSLQSHFMPLRRDWPLFVRNASNRTKELYDDIEIFVTSVIIVVTVSSAWQYQTGTKDVNSHKAVKAMFLSLIAVASPLEATLI